jgi:hypothetical protein
MIQTIIAMSHKGYLDQEGGFIFIEYVFKQTCSLNNKPAVDAKGKPLDINPQAIKLQSENALNMITTTIDTIDEVLWPNLFEFFGRVDFFPSSNLLSTCLINILSRKTNITKNYMDIKFDEHANIPKRFELLALFITYAFVPLQCNNRGVNIMKLMKHISFSINPKIEEFWDTIIPKMIGQLQGLLK